MTHAEHMEEKNANRGHSNRRKSARSEAGGEDAKLRDGLLEIDAAADRMRVTEWESDFIESVCFKNATSPLTSKQQRSAREIISKYAGRL